VTLQGPSRNTFPSLGKKCGRRERESRRRGRREQSFREAHQSCSLRVVMVEDIPVAWKAALFAGRCRNGGLGSVRAMESGSSTLHHPPTTTDVRRTPRRGTQSVCAHKQAHAPRASTSNRAGDEGTRPSLGPSTRARQSSLCSAAQAAEVGRTQEHHGWASSGQPGRNQHWGSGGRTERGSPLVTALAREAAWSVRKGRGSWSPSLRGTRVEVWLPARQTQLQKSVGDV